VRDEDIKYINELEDLVQELEEKHKEYVSFTESNNYNMDVEFEKLYKRNKRYREAIEKALKTLDDNPVNVFDLLNAKSELRKGLERESE